MKTTPLIFLSLLLFAQQSISQNLGINTTTPTERLHVNGNVNISNGTLKTNGREGQAGQVLGITSAGNMAWVNTNEYKFFQSISGFGTTETNTTWTVPAGVTKIMVEAWGGGAGGNKAGIGGGGSGGDAGGYSRGIITVVPGQVANITLGGGGLGLSGLYNSGNSGEPGHYTRLTVNSSSIEAKGGCFGCGTLTTGNNTCFGCLSFFSLEGEEGYERSEHYEQTSATDFVKNKNFGDGGSAAYTFYKTGGKGEQSNINLASASLSVISFAKSGITPAGGGGGCSYQSPGLYICGNGGAGMVIIYY